MSPLARHLRKLARLGHVIFISLLALPACLPAGGQRAAEPVPHGAAGGDPDASAPLQPGKATSFIAGSVAGRNDYRLFELGGFNAGDRLTLESDQLFNSYSLFTVVVLDDDMNLLERTPSFPSRDLVHVMRRSSQSVVVGVRPTYDDSGGDFNIRVTRRSGQSIPAPAGQVVYLNFGPGSAVRVHTRTGISFSSFNAARISDDYAGTTATTATPARPRSSSSTASRPSR